MKRIFYALLSMLACWPLLVSVAPAPPPLLAAVAHQAPPATVVVPRRSPALSSRQQVSVALPDTLPAPAPGCTRQNALYYLEAAVDGGLRGRASAWSCRSLEEAQQYLQFHLSLIQ